ncbi:ABC transporter permease [Aquimarina sp. 2201CG5-10]|uniref:ABC transporter permease n=1 Tax=Aquimarina callyspongiae TaxID=3098150 RepID=UPI002AB43089|nr:FtsX-like permease family protein [Aquimarina sp. 2201CG5-10]MDY8137527.1 FtsX-like permease family protein [Aquimarina sp. 2201CG5-10]
MFRNYIKIAWRNLVKQKVFSFINIISLSIGLSASFIIGMMVYYDFTFDKFHEDGDRIYRVVTNFESPQEKIGMSVTDVQFVEDLNYVSGINVIAPFYEANLDKIKSSQRGAEFEKPKHVIYTEKEYFELFQYTWLAGDPLDILERTNEVVLSEKRANKYFPQLKPSEIIGKTITYNDSIIVQVTGVVQNFKNRSDLVFEEFISSPTLKNNNPPVYQSQLFIKIDKNVEIATIQKQANAIVEKSGRKYLKVSGMEMEFGFQPLHDIHFNTEYEIYDKGRARPDKSILLSLIYIAVFLLLLGCINFINLNTAQATKRSKEIGIRKTLGGSKKQLIIQFLGETFLLTILSSLISLIITVGLLEVFSEFIPGGLGISVFIEPIAIGILISILFGVTLLSGFYPALVLSGFKPISVLKNKATSGKNSSFFRSSLTVFQFTIAQIFLLATLLVGKQIHFMLNKNMGFRSEAIAFTYFPWEDSSLDKRKRFTEKIKSIPDVKLVSFGGEPPAGMLFPSYTTYIDGEKEIKMPVHLLNGDLNYLEIYEIPLLAGRKRLSDSSEEFIINETYSKLLGFKTPEEALGKYLKSSISNSNPYPIVGVMKDFNQRSLKSKIEPMALKGRRRSSTFSAVHFSLHRKESENWSDIIKKVETFWKEIYPNKDFEVRFMDETIQNFYQQEYQISKLLKWATAIVILISCLGLLGLVIHTTEKRTKEISVRKVLGAPITRLIVLICSEFLKLLIVAFLIAIPIAVWWSKNWLQEFAYRTSISLWIFLISGLGMFIVAILIMGTRVFKTATLNPIKNLRAE